MEQRKDKSKRLENKGKSWHANDLFWKTDTIRFVNALFHYHGIDIEVDVELPTEIGGIDYREIRIDFLGMTKNGEIIYVEFQSNNPTNVDMMRFNNYYCAIKNKYRGKTIIPFIVTREITKEEYKTVQLDPFNEFKMKMISPKSINADKILNTINKKIKNKDKLSCNEIKFLQFGFLTTTIKNDYELFKTLIELTKKIEIKDKKIIEDTLIYQTIMAQMILNDKDYKKIIKVISMRSVYEDVYNYGVEEGIDQGKWDMVDNLIKKGFSDEEIQECSGFTQEQITEHKKQL